MVDIQIRVSKGLEAKWEGPELVTNHTSMALITLEITYNVLLFFFCWNTYH